MKILESTSTSVTVGWEPLHSHCNNCKIVGYSVQYEETEGAGEKQKKRATGCSVTEVTITDLRPSTTYSFQVAAINIAGAGDYSDAEDVETKSGVFNCT